MFAFLFIIVSTFSVDLFEVYATGSAFLPQLKALMALSSWNHT